MSEASDLMSPKMNNPSFLLNLPSEITTDIFSRLPVRTIITCKCVCKKWLELISSPEFAKTHLSKPIPGLIVYLTQGVEILCRIFEFEDVVGLQHHNLHYKPFMKFDPKILPSSPKGNIHINCSVNGLLCLQDYGNELDTLYICNPCTREYISLPGLEGAYAQYPNVVTYGIGISTLSCQYKVVRIFHEPVASSGIGFSGLKLECMIYTLGTGSWRNVQPNLVYDYNLRSSTGVFLSGSLHWLVADGTGPDLISCFDLETEMFKPFLPPYPGYFFSGSTLSVVGECLCICDFGDDDEIVIWIMKEYGVEGSWMKEFVINKHPDLDFLTYESVYTLKVFEDGDILMSWDDGCLFYHCQKTESNPEIDLFERGANGCNGGLVHTPSFVSLRSFSLESVSLF